MSDVEGDDVPAAPVVASTGGAMGIDKAIQVSFLYLQA